MKRSKNPTILAIESSADETSAAVFKNGKIASNIVYSQIAKHTKTGGIVPEVAAREHIPKIIPAIKLALKKSKTKLSDIDAFAVTRGPGLMTSLLIGVDTAKTLAFALDKPIIPINHLEGHLLSAFNGKNFQFPISNFQKSFFPAIGLVVSGGHTMIVLAKGIGQYKILGETLDDAAGEAFDKIAKILGLGYPGGPIVSLRATKFKNQNSKVKIELPRPMIDSKNYNFSFSGLKTAALYKVENIKKQKQLNDHTINQLCYETEQAIVDVLVEKTVRAAAEYKAKSVLLGGGVAANKKLRTTLKQKIQKNTKAKMLIPDFSLTGDNAGMIALAASYHYLNNNLSSYKQIKVDPNLELKSWKSD